VTLDLHLDLDGWARAVRATNDDEALYEVRRLYLGLAEAEDAVRWVRSQLADGPDGRALDCVLAAWRNLDEALDVLAEVVDGFARHERGGRS